MNEFVAGSETCHRKETLYISYIEPMLSSM